MASCAECHTPRDSGGQLVPGMDFAGGNQFAHPELGYRVRSANITPDADTGIGQWTEEQFINKFKGFEAPDDRVLTDEEQRQNTAMPWKAVCRHDTRRPRRHLPLPPLAQAGHQPRGQVARRRESPRGSSAGRVVRELCTIHLAHGSHPRPSFGSRRHSCSMSLCPAPTIWPSSTARWSAPAASSRPPSRCGTARSRTSTARATRSRPSA